MCLSSAIHKLRSSAIANPVRNLRCRHSAGIMIGGKLIVDNAFNQPMNELSCHAEQMALIKYFKLYGIANAKNMFDFSRPLNDGQRRRFLPTQ